MVLIVLILFSTLSFTHCTTVTSEQAPAITKVNTVSQPTAITDKVVVTSESVNLKVERSEKSYSEKTTEKEVEEEKSTTQRITENKFIEQAPVNEIENIATQGKTEVKNQSLIHEEKQTAVEAFKKFPKEDILNGNSAAVIELISEKDKTLIDQNELSHEKWDAILQANVSANGNVNYIGIKSNEKQLDEYLSLISNNTPENTWSKDKTKAYWINAYNAFTIKLILNNYPVGSIKDLCNGKPWDKKWIKLGNKTYSLNDIEHVILRPTYNDPRIHFAVNCAAKSCPKVWNKAWTEDNVESALDKLTKEFIANTSANQISEKKVSLSKIFDWYKEDFGDLIIYLNKYSATKVSPSAKITFNEYNWNLNS